MTQVDAQLSTGLNGLDRVLKGLIPGDNIVWQVDAIDEYVPFVEPYCRFAQSAGQRLIYFRFARHQPLVAAEDGAEVHHLRPEAGFEQFITEIHRVIHAVGRRGYYLFDCLSDLAVDWYSDQMLGNFFKLTCPYLYDVEAIAYFPLLRGHHSFHATLPISETTQVLLDVRRHAGELYLHPVKVQHRHSSTMYMLHAWRGEEFVPVRESARIATILRGVPWHHMESASHRLDVWSRTFRQAMTVQTEVRTGQAPRQAEEECFHRLLRMAISRDERILRLAERHLTLNDLLEIGSRVVGTGLIGGKAVGMLLGRAILEQGDPRWKQRLEPHDSFFIGSDVFYTFLVGNGIWWARQRQREPASFLEGAETARQRILVGEFPDYIVRQFADMLDYFGQSPIIVRSSSLLEDGFGNAFAGKYESVFCVNQGPRHKRLEDFLSAVRTIYASSMSEKALTYRAQRGILERDEQMALLVQRVSGAVHDGLFYPQAAGVGLSYNPYVWSRDIDPAAGVLRLVFGLGTRAVDRFDDDYTRLVAMNAPHRRPESSFEQARRYAQKKADVLDLQANLLLSKSFAEVAQRSVDLPLDLFASRDGELTVAAATPAGEAAPWLLTFDNLLRDTPLVEDMRAMLASLQKAYNCPVEVEFTANFMGGGAYWINLLQCRPFQGKGGVAPPAPPRNIAEKDLVLRAGGAVIGQSRQTAIDRLIYVSPADYGQLPIADRYKVARLIGRLCHVDGPRRGPAVMLLGPGRWGTTTPSLGVPIRFSDVNSISVLCEIVAMRDDLVPDVSLGTHLFSEMVELDILYMALFPSREGNSLNREFFENAPNRLAGLAPDAAEWGHVVRVIDAADLGDGAVVKLHADMLNQKVVCYLERR